MITTNDKLNSIYQTKLRIKNVIQTESDEFSEYPDLIAAAIGSGGSDKVSYSYLNEKLTYYVEKDELYNSSYATQSYVVNYVATYAPTPDLSAYVTKDELSAQSYLTAVPNTYPTYAAIESMGYITSNDLPDLSSYVSYSYLESKHYLDSIPNTYATYEAISDMGYLTSIPNDYPTYAAISEMSYATQSYVVDYVAEHSGGGSTVIDENIIPKENNTYTLGSDTYQYVSTYTYWVGAYNSGTTIDNAHGVKIIINGNDRFYYANSQFRPLADNYCNLGLSTAQWKSTYTYNLYSPSLVLSYSYNSIDNASNTQINFKINGWNRAKLTNTTFCPSTNNGIKLGDSGAQWGSSYVRDLYLDGTNIKTAINGMFSYDSSTGTLTITTLS